MAARSLYAVLQVAPDADDVTLRRAYKQLGALHHPDANPGDPHAAARWRAVCLAYEVLADPDRRASYAEFGEASLKSGFDAAAARRRAEREKRSAEIAM